MISFLRLGRWEIQSEIHGIGNPPQKMISGSASVSFLSCVLLFPRGDGAGFDRNGKKILPWPVTAENDRGSVPSREKTGIRSITCRVRFVIRSMSMKFANPLIETSSIHGISKEACP